MPVCILQAQLVAAFQPEELRRLVVLHNLEGRWESIFSAEDTIDEAVFKLVEWAKSRGRLEELARAASSERPKNELLRAAYDLIRGLPPESDTRRVGTPPWRRQVNQIDPGDRIPWAVGQIEEGQKWLEKELLALQSSQKATNDQLAGMSRDLHTMKELIKWGVVAFVVIVGILVWHIVFPGAPKLLAALLATLIAPVLTA